MKDRFMFLIAFNFLLIAIFILIQVNLVEMGCLMIIANSGVMMSYLLHRWVERYT